MSDRIRIPVYPHVRRYLQIQFGESINATDRNYASVLLRSLLKKFDKKEPWKVRPSSKLDLGGTFDILIGNDGIQRLGGYLSNTDILKFSQAIDLLIRQEMYRWCHHPNATDHVIDFNIRRFIDFYGFAEDDLPFDNLKRWYFRERQRINKRVTDRLNEEYKVFISYASAENTPLSSRWRLREQDVTKSLPAHKECQLIIPFQ